MRHLWATLTLLLCHQFAFGQAQGRIDREAASAKTNGKSDAHIAGPIVNHVRHETLADLVAQTHPVLATVISRASSVEPTERDVIVTYYLLRIDNNIKKSALPQADNSAIFGDALQHSDPTAAYTIAAQVGGSVMVQGIRIAMEPTEGMLAVGKQYFLFLFPGTAGQETVGSDGSALLVGEDGKTSLLHPSPGPKLLDQLVGKKASDVIGILQGTTGK